MYTRLKDRTHYEGRYDCFTVELGRRGRYHYQQFLQQFTQDLKQLNPSEDISRPGNAILANLFYMQVLGYDLLERYENRDQSISELIQLLTPIVEAQGYSHFNFSTPQTSRHLTVDFNCLNANPNRKAHQSVRDLKRLINDQLLFTNWRLMSDGIHCRLGLLSGRLKAIETPEELRALAEKLYKDGKVTKNSLSG